MNLPIAELTSLEAILNHFCRTRCPEHLHDRVQLTFRIEGLIATIFERRPYFHDRSRWTQTDIARFRYFKNRDVWELYWVDRNSRWHRYGQCRANHSIEPLLADVDKNSTGIFWG
jgi:hypothetical protein